MSETPTATFGILPVGSIFRICWTYQPLQKIDSRTAANLSHTHYQLPPWREVRQDWYIQNEWEQAQEDRCLTVTSAKIAV